MTTPESIVNHPLWCEVKKYIFIQPYHRDGGLTNPRVRIWLKGIPKEKMEKFLQIEVACAACQNKMNPIRKSQRGDYYAATCPLEKRISCSRNKAASEEYLKIREAVGYE